MPRPPTARRRIRIQAHRDTRTRQDRQTPMSVPCATRRAVLMSDVVRLGYSRDRILSRDHPLVLPGRGRVSARLRRDVAYECVTFPPSLSLCHLAHMTPFMACPLHMHMCLSGAVLAIHRDPPLSPPPPHPTA